MSRKQPPPPPPLTFPEPFAEARTTNRTRNAAGDPSIHHQAGPPPGNIPPPQLLSPSAHTSQPHSGHQPPPIHRSTHPHFNTSAPAPAHEHGSRSYAPQPLSGSVSSHPPFPGAHEHGSRSYAPQPLSGSVSSHPPFPVPEIPARYPPTNIPSHPPARTVQDSPIPVHPNIDPPVPYHDSSPPRAAYRPLHSEIPGRSQPIATTWSYSDVHGRGDDLRHEDPERRVHSSGHEQWGPPNRPVGPGGQPRRAEEAPVSCRLCGRLKSYHEVAHLDGFCSERHKWEWFASRTDN